MQFYIFDTRLPSLLRIPVTQSSITQRFRATLESYVSVSMSNASQMQVKKLEYDYDHTPKNKSCFTRVYQHNLIIK